MKKSQLKRLDFWFINEIRPGIYEKIYAKDTWQKGTMISVFEDRVAFWDESGSDHRCVIPFKDILMA